MVSASTFEALVDDLVRARLSRPTDWATLLVSLPGVYPQVVREAMVRLGLVGMVRQSGSSRPPKAVTAIGAWERGLLPTPHILDGTWWFSDSAIETMLGRIAEHTNPGDSVLLLGTPTLFFAGSDRLADRTFSLVDNDVPALQNLAKPCRFINANILENDLLLPIDPTIIVVDPPWYIGETLSFLWLARRHARNGTKILLSTPPEGTRPGVPDEWARLLVWCGKVGLELKEHRRSELAYVTPPFERNALRAAGVPECPMDWRRGDLAVFVCTQDQMCPEPQIDPSPRSIRWSDASIGRVRIRMRAGEHSDMSPPFIEQLFQDDVLPTVSRRDKRLHKVRLWTSGNRVFGCRGETAIRSIVEALAAGVDPLRTVRKDLHLGLDQAFAFCVEATAAQLDQIIKSEERELLEWNRCLSHDVVELAS